VILVDFGLTAAGTEVGLVGPNGRGSGRFRLFDGGKAGTSGAELFRSS